MHLNYSDYNYNFYKYQPNSHYSEVHFTPRIKFHFIKHKHTAYNLTFKSFTRIIRKSYLNFWLRAGRLTFNDTLNTHSTPPNVINWRVFHSFSINHVRQHVIFQLIVVLKVFPSLQSAIHRGKTAAKVLHIRIQNNAFAMTQN